MKNEHANSKWVGLVFLKGHGIIELETMNQMARDGHHVYL